MAPGAGDAAMRGHSRYTHEHTQPYIHWRYTGPWLCMYLPQFNVFPSITFEAELKKMVFHRMLEEQSGILNFLSDQKTAVINDCLNVTIKTNLIIKDIIIVKSINFINKLLS